MTVQELITGALRAATVIAAGESPSTDESNDALVALNELVASWSAQALPIYQITRGVVPLTGAASYVMATRPVKIKAAAISVTTTVSLPLTIATPQQWAEYMDKGGNADFPDLLWYEDGYPLGKIHVAPLRPAGGTLELLTERVIGGGGLLGLRETFPLTGAASYTIGVGGVFATERPARITGAAVQAGSNVSRPLRLVTAEGWAEYPKKGVGGLFGEVLYYDGGYPSATIWVAPKPAAGSLELYTYEKLANFASLATVIDLPTGYLRALRFSLALELAPEYGRPIDHLVPLAEDAKASVFGLNASILGHPAQSPATPAAPPAQAVPPAQEAAQ